MPSSLLDNHLTNHPKGNYALSSLSFAVVLSVCGVLMIRTTTLTSPFGCLLLGCAMTLLYRVGLCCSSLETHRPFKSGALNRVLGQVALLLLLRPYGSLHTRRADTAKGTGASKHVSWIGHKLKSAFSINRQVEAAKRQSQLKHPLQWIALQFCVLGLFVAIFFPTMILKLGLSGVVRYWLIPFVVMHFQIGTFDTSVSKSAAHELASFTDGPAASPTTELVIQATNTCPSVRAPAVCQEPWKPHWFNIIYLGIMHLASLYALTLVLRASWLTIALACTLQFTSALGVTAGVHRLWSHRSYKAHPILEFFLVLCFSMANQGTIYKWARDHRIHHKHVDTDKDPHNAERGFWYSHIGWLMHKKTDKVIKAGRRVHMTDLDNNSFVMFQKRYALLLSQTLCFVFPSVCAWMWTDTWCGFWVAGVLRYVVQLHFTWCVNSLAHLWGERPYLPDILPVDNVLVAVLTIGEGWHNYHHAYPYDYSTNEYGFLQWNPTTLFLDICTLLGLCSDLRRATLKSGADSIPDNELPGFSMQDVAASGAQAASLLVIDGIVYDIATFSAQGLHPGGEKILASWYGKDATQVFHHGSRHSHTPVAVNLLHQYRVGRIVSL